VSINSYHVWITGEGVWLTKQRTRAISLAEALRRQTRVWLSARSGVLATGIWSRNNHLWDQRETKVSWYAFYGGPVHEIQPLQRRACYSSASLTGELEKIGFNRSFVCQVPARRIRKWGLRIITVKPQLSEGEGRDSAAERLINSPVALYQILPEARIKASRQKPKKYPAK